MSYNELPSEVKMAQLQMFGETEAAIETALASAKRMGYTNAMYVMSILSDVQEVILHGSNETARQWLNKAKYILSTHCMKDEEFKVEVVKALKGLSLTAP